MSAKNSERVLFITREYPWPTHTGALQYSAMLLRALAQQTSSLHVLCSESCVQSEVDDMDELNDVIFHQFQEESLDWKKQCFTNLPQATLRKLSASGVGKLQQLLEQQWSLIVVDHIASAWSYPLLCQYRKQTQQLLYCTHNEEFSTRLSIAASEQFIKAPMHLIDACRAKGADAHMFELADAVTCISSNDMSAYQRYRFAQQTPLHLLSPIYTDVPCHQRIVTPKTPRIVCLLGSFIWSAKKRNLLLFLQACTPLFTKHAIQIKIIGNMRQEFREKLQRRWPEVHFTGSVNNIASYLNDVRLAVIPEQAGGGFKLKSLEYVFQRLPIFALKQGLVDLPLEEQHSVQLYADLPSLAKGIVQCIDDDMLLNNMQQRAFDACTAFIGMEAMVQKLEEVVYASRM
ncbi:MAG: glycosyltransferase [Mariprofundaceae bacterium]|nr:glycosyltransferase [Mariprofundaceae bacterium]